MNELLIAYALGAFLGGATVFAFLVAVILNLRTELFIREKQLNLYTQDVPVNECMEEKVEWDGEDILWKGDPHLVETGTPVEIPEVLKGLAKALKEYSEMEEGYERRKAYTQYTDSYQEAQKQVLEAVKEGDKQNETEPNIWFTLLALRILRGLAWRSLEELPSLLNFQIWEDTNKSYLAILFGLSEADDNLLSDTIDRYQRGIYG